MFCPNCGKEIPDTSKVCGFCGNKVPVKVEVSPPTPQSEPKPESKPVTPPQPETQPESKPVTPRPAATQPEAKPATPPPSKPKPVPPVVEKPKAKPSKSPGMPKWVWGVIGAVVLAGAVFLYFQYLAPKPQPLYIANCSEYGGKLPAKAGQPIDLYYGGWGAHGFELAEDNSDHITYRLLVDGKAISGKRQKAIPTDEVPCNMQLPLWFDGAYWSFYKTRLAPLSVGEHDLLITQTIDTQITDGFDSDGDGQDDLYGPGNKTFEYTITVVP
jgi:hypothetical protein